MAYDDDETPGYPRPIPPNEEVPQSRRRRPRVPEPHVTPEMRRLVTGIARRHPNWDVRMIHTQIRIEPGRNDITLAMIGSILETWNAHGRPPSEAY